MRPLVNACPSEDEILCYLESTAGPELTVRLQTHVDECEACRVLIAELVRHDDELR
jgi:hypothetical protein